MALEDKLCEALMPCPYPFQYHISSSRIGLYVNIISKANCKTLCISSSFLYANPVADLLYLFDYPPLNIHAMLMPRLLQVTPELINNINNFVDKYKGNHPEINKLNSFLKKIDLNSHIIIYPTLEKLDLPIIDFDMLSAYLAVMDNYGDNPYKKHERFKEFYGKFLATYDHVGADGTTRLHFGEPDKSKRECRYCHMRMPDVTFDKKGHTISESLGNKTIITNTECDGCNERFGNGIERDLAEYFNFFNVFYGINGKTGKRTYKGKNFEFRQTDTGDLLLTIRTDADASDVDLSCRSQVPSILLESYQNIRMQNLYKAIAKFAVGILPDGLLGEFSQTIDGYAGEKHFHFYLI